MAAADAGHLTKETSMNKILGFLGASLAALSVGCLQESDRQGDSDAAQMALMLMESGELVIDGDGHAEICHIPPGNPENAHTLRVGEPAVVAHLAHGDYPGACREIPQEPCEEEPTGTKVSADGAKDHKTDICHLPPGNPGNARTLSIDTSAVAAHLAHGDYLGVCGRPLPPDCGSDEGGETVTEEDAPTGEPDEGESQESGEESPDMPSLGT